MNVLKAILFVVVGLLFLACEKVIDLDLDEASPTLVIEAVLREGEHTFEVSIARSTSYFDNTSQEVVENAAVVLQDDRGNSYTVPHINGGVYAADVVGEAGRTYTLRAAVDGREYTATSSLRQEVVLEELVYEFVEANAFNDAGYSLFVRFQDPPNEANYYRLIHSINGIEQKSGEDLQVVDDALIDGGYARLPLFQQVFDPGTLVTVELIHLDETSYTYFSTLGDIIDTGGGPGGATAAPANPSTNWSGGILGYFSAQNASRMSVQLPS